MSILRPPTSTSTDLLEPDYRVEFDAWRANPTPASMTPLLKKLQPEIDRGISAHVGSSNPLIQSQARKMALGAIRNYDPKRAKLGTHVVNQLQGLKRVIRKQNMVVSIPERMQLNLNYLHRAQNDLEDALGREPTLDELADNTGLSRQRIMNVRRLKMPVAEGQLQTSQSSEDGGGYSPAVQPQDRQDTWLWVVYDDQDNINKKIMEWTLAMSGNPRLSNTEIARRLRLSPGAISQRKAKIQQLLDQRAELGG